MAASERAGRRVVIRGHVQGVFFRESIRRLARQHGVTGWVRNNWDGSVEALFEGSADAVARLVEFCHRGPRGARVDSVEETTAEPEAVDGFEVR